MISIAKPLQHRRRSALPDAGDVTYALPMDRLDDNALMLRYAEQHDVSAFEELYRRHKDSVFRYLLRNCRATAAAEDVFQEVWSKLIKSRATYRPTAKFTTFLFRVAHNAFIDHLRRNKRYATDEDRTELVESDEPSPEEATESALLREKMLRALSNLPAEQRDAWLLREEAGLSVQEIATVMQIGHEAAKSRLRYANQKLRQTVTVR